MLGRLGMSVEQTIDEYLKLSEEVFTPKHRFNKLAELKNLWQGKGRCSAEALASAVKKVVAKHLGPGHEDDLLMEESPKCHV
jgi:hypothetical protein